MSSSSFYSDSGVTTADADAVESSKNAAAQSAQDAQTHANTASTKASEASDSAIDAAASASTANNSNVQAVAANLGGTNTIGTVAGNIADINTVAGMESDVDTVANSSYKAKVETVADSSYKSDVETVAASSYKSDVETVADSTYKAKVETVANSTYKTKVEEVAADLSGSNTIGAAVQSASDAATSASNASTSETNAASSESTAATHASNASTHATTASGHADDAEDAKTAAQAARDAAQGHRTQTGQDATAAAASANSASSSASDAASSEANAAADALVASNSADSAKIDANVVKNISSTYGTLNAAINSASSSASQAASSASTASTHANTASGHASTAASHAANLGSVAYQNLTAIAESKSRNAADVFVYDTSKDSDGGAWRNRTQGKSWYNEALSNSTRGATKKFPAVAVIVGHNGAGNDGGVDIYDATDPTCPLWMRFEGDYSWGHGKMLVVAGRTSHGEITSVTMRDAKLFVGCKDQNSTSSGLFEIDFMTERCKFRKSPRGNGYNVLTNHANIAARNESEGISPKASGDFEGLISSFVNDVAVTVLPNAPIDPDTGLPVPTIAVATEGGVSVVKDDGSVVDITGQVSGIRAVAWMGDKLVTNGVYGDAKAVYAAPSADQTHSVNEGYYVWQDAPSVFAGSTLDQIVTKEDRTIVSGCAKGLQHIHHKDGDSHASLSNQITTSYNTGWMNGDTKLATLMDTTAETISGGEFVTNGDFSNGLTGWSVPSGSSSTATVNNGALTGVRNNEDVVEQTLSTPLTAGEIYNISFDITYISSNHWVYFRTSSQNITPNGAGNETPVGSYSHTFTATSNDTTLFLRAGGTGGLTFTIDNISLTKAVPDRSINNNGLTTFGNVTKDAVATGAELVGYKFDLDANKLVMPSASSIGDPTYDYCWMWWQRGTDMLLGTSAVTSWQATGGYNPTTAGYYFSFGGSGGSKVLRINRVNSSLGVGNIDLTFVGVDSGIDSESFNHICVVKKGSDMHCYINGKHERSRLNHPLASELETTQGGSFGLYESGNGDVGRMALLKISSTAPTPEQIAKIYRDEKPLFQEGAKCTLYGNSNDVNGLSYDDDTGITHAGTPNSNGTGGISEFTGLQRTGINSNTTSVGAAVSAQTGLVVSE